MPKVWSSNRGGRERALKRYSSGRCISTVCCWRDRSSMERRLKIKGWGLPDGMMFLRGRRKEKWDLRWKRQGWPGWGREVTFTDPERRQRGWMGRLLCGGGGSQSRLSLEEGVRWLLNGGRKVVMQGVEYTCVMLRFPGSFLKFSFLFGNNFTLTGDLQAKFDKLFFWFIWEEVANMVPHYPQILYCVFPTKKNILPHNQDVTFKTEKCRQIHYYHLILRPYSSFTNCSISVY